MPKYSIVIPTYNHCDDFLKPCIESILKYTIVPDIELIISANGCTDNTRTYLQDLKSTFLSCAFSENIKIVWSDEPLGYPKAVNAGIRVATGEYLIMMNNDTVLLHQSRNKWLEMLEEPFLNDCNMGIAGPLKLHSKQTGYDFIVFFLAMFSRRLMEDIGLLDEDFGCGSSEDIDYAARAIKYGYNIHQICDITHIDNNGTVEFNVGGFPIFHHGEGTVHDENLVQNWSENMKINEIKLAEKYK